MLSGIINLPLMIAALSFTVTFTEQETLFHSVSSYLYQVYFDVTQSVNDNVGYMCIPRLRLQYAIGLMAA